MRVTFIVYNKKAEVLFIGSARDEEAAEKRMLNKSWAHEIDMISYQPFISSNMEKLIFRHRPRYHPAWAKSYENQPRPSQLRRKS